ncbi:RNA polymerase II subunit A C-terminal domain phosphatase SSU72-like [Schistocerca gregaria]|uniref:RNA polymerase II subunit A C-terminal domain phosphatase SSU72-like n=1 Tax=Schistocerca gregaria TaxID=7010 RepID=UPI00211E766D|nr:RNA polymerase II subunit A C-terminal domain phosphatase SSU72-like [Schistocerca gregaria]
MPSYFTDKSIAAVCASNVNRSMEAHYLFLRKGVQNVYSFGTSSQVKLPGTTQATPNIYDFKKTYAEIYEDLIAKDEEFYRRKGLLSMIHRNMKVKPRPQRFQDEVSLQFDIIFTFEDRVYDVIVDDLLHREASSHQPVHIINFTIKDSHEDAIVGARNVYRLFQIINSKGDTWVDEVDAAIDEFKESSDVDHSILHCTMFY